MSKSIPPADRDLFRAETEGIEPLRHDQVEPYRQRPRPRPRPRLADDDELLDTLSEAEVDTHEYLEFARPGIQKRLFSDLQRGDLEIGLELDLHGLTAELARETLWAFLRECHERRIRCARIIHGKGFGSGQPVLKRKVNYWLRLRRDVLAFCSATRRDGGTGALYVLLRNPNKARAERAGQR
ncbi:Smr/MutS family protein [Thioalkalicoccus limnaeus]|uniref:Smr/MutS family protein n=1 Tax=Thioalkalicoccus limnaeus TaxID=120681 RepID=A0ABV4BCC7_9GAMM